MAFFNVLFIFAESENSAVKESKLMEKKAQDFVELTQDENLSLTRLPNGVTIAVYPNSEPPKRLSMRLLVRRGSSTETKGEEGLAHFIEHMAFNGTSNFPKGDMIEYFQRLGMAFGADTNAHTSFTETVYKIDMPNNDSAMIKNGIMLLSDYASGILFNPEEIERERGVIIAEKKSRDTAGYRAMLSLIKTLFPDSIYAKRFPIGEESTIQSAPRSAFLNFYKANYRTENFVLLVVGDVKVSAILDLAKKYFAPITDDNSVKASVEDSSVFLANPSEPMRAFSFVDEDMRESSGTIYIVSSPMYKEDCLEKRVRDMRLSLISKVLTLRFNSRKLAKDSQFTSAYADFGAFEKYAEIFSIAAISNVKNSRNALEESVKMYRGALENGFGDWELNKAKAEIINSLESEVRGKSTRQSVLLANAITEVLSNGDILSSPETDLKIALQAFKDFNAENANILFRDLITKSSVFAQTKDSENESGAEEIRFVLERFLSEAGKIALSEPLDETELVYADFGVKGELIKESVDELGIKRLVFKNGLRANLKKTDFAKDELVINISFGGGKLDLPADKPALSSILSGFILGGTKSQTFDEINVAKSDKNIAISFGGESDYFSLAASFAPKYLEDACSILATYLREPAFREDAMASIKKNIDAKYRQIETNPEASLLKVEGWLTDGNVRLRFPEKEEVEALTIADLKAWLEPIIKKSYMEISVVGDFDEEEVKACLLKMFASLDEKESSRKDYSNEKKVSFTKEKSLLLNVNNVNDNKSIAVRIWPSCDRSDIKKMRAANILGAVLNDNVRKIVRESSGKVYSPFAYNNSSAVFSFGVLSAGSDVVPAFNEEVSKLLLEAAQKTAKAISQDEFDRAKEPILKQVEKARRMNSYWASAVMPMLQADALKFETAKTFEKGYAEITIEDVRKAAAEFLNGKESYDVRIMPKAK